MNENIVRMGLMKCIPSVWDVKENIKKFEKHAYAAKEKGVKLLVTCECFLDGYSASEKDFSKDKFALFAQDMKDSVYLQKVRSIAKELQMFIVFGFSLKDGDGAKNAALFVDDEGNDVGVYIKTHLHDQDLAYTGGDDLPVFDTSIGKIGIMICADRRFPEVSRCLKLKGAELIVNPSYGMWGYENEWWMRTKAYENEIYIAFAHARTCFICNPEGVLEARMSGNVPDILVHDVDLSVKVNKTMPVRRPELYGKICDDKEGV